MAKVVLGAQWGDEGKGKIVDILGEGVQLCCRAQGGHNAGHTIVKNGKTFDVHILRESRNSLVVVTRLTDIAQRPEFSPTDASTLLALAV